MTDNDIGVKPAFRWSFSQWDTYNTCPAKWKFGSVMKLPRKPAGPAAARGSEIHDSVEQYIKGGDMADLHQAVKKKYIPILDEFKYHHNGDRYTEKKIALDADWDVCDQNSKFASCITVLDASRYSKTMKYDKEIGYSKLTTGELEIGEWKSGKPKETHRDQRLLYAVAGWKYWMADIVRVTTYYLEDTAPPERTTLNSEEGFQKLTAMWDDRIKTMQRDQLCAPRPGYYCRWCDFSKDAGGPCLF